jgi:hypothetical protein
MAGLPDIDTIDSYGGAKVNEAEIADPSTDESADDINVVKMNVAGATQTLDRAWVRFVGHATTPADPASNVHGAVWGNGPDVKPVVAKGGTGIYDVTWPTVVTDELGVNHNVNLRAAVVGVEGATPYLWTATVTAPNVVRVRIFITTPAASDAVGVTFLLTVK